VRLSRGLGEAANAEADATAQGGRICPATRRAKAVVTRALGRDPLVSPAGLYNWHRAEGGMDTDTGREIGKSSPRVEGR
jgi:hypothetical protein